MVPILCKFIEGGFSFPTTMVLINIVKSLIQIDFEVLLVLTLIIDLNFEKTVTFLSKFEVLREKVLGCTQRFWLRLTVESAFSKRVFTSVTSS